MASRSSCSCASDPTRFSTTPASRTRPDRDRDSRARRPATDALMADASTTSTTGASSSRATSAVDEGEPSTAPSKRPITPSTIRRSAAGRRSRRERHDRLGPAQPGIEVPRPDVRTRGRVVAGVDEVGSDLRRRRPVTPRRRTRPAGPVATVVLPDARRHAGDHDPGSEHQQTSVRVHVGGAVIVVVGHDVRPRGAEWPTPRGCATRSSRPGHAARYEQVSQFVRCTPSIASSRRCSITAHEVRVGSEVAGVEHIDARTSDSNSLTSISCALDELARGEEPEEQRHPLMAEACAMRSRASGTDGHVDAREPDVDVGRTRPLGQQARGAARLRVRIRVGRTTRRRAAAEAAPHRPPRGCGRAIARSSGTTPSGEPNTRSTSGCRARPFEHDRGHIVLAVAGREQHQRLDRDAGAAPSHQVVEHGPGRRVGQLEEAEVDVQVRSGRRRRPRPSALASATPPGRSSRGPRAAAPCRRQPVARSATMRSPSRRSGQRVILRVRRRAARPGYRRARRRW